MKYGILCAMDEEIETLKGLSQQNVVDVSGVSFYEHDRRPGRGLVAPGSVKCWLDNDRLIDHAVSR